MKAVVVFDALRNGCKSYSSIARYADVCGVAISEKTIRRHINLLWSIGYKVHESKDGFLITGRPKVLRNHKSNDPSIIDPCPSAYPILILNIFEGIENFRLDQKTILFLLKKDYKCNISRRALSRNINGLRELGYIIDHNKEGYKLLGKIKVLNGEKTILNK